jgi:ATP-dependent protease ClpP protease subunit
MMGKRKAADEDSDEHAIVKTTGSDVWYYGPVTQKSVVDMCLELRRLAKLRRKNIVLHICSEGGDAYAGLAGLAGVEECGAQVEVRMEGHVCSAATLIALGGHTRRVMQHCQVLVHQVSGENWGEYNKMQDEVANMKTLMEEMNKIYRTRTRIPETHLEEMMTRDIFLDSDTARQYLDYPAP